MKCHFINYKLNIVNFKIEDHQILLYRWNKFDVNQTKSHSSITYAQFWPSDL